MSFGDLTLAEHDCLRKYVRTGDHLDIGTRSGGSAATAAEVCEGLVWTLDINMKHLSSRRIGPELMEKIIPIEVGSLEWEIPERRFGSAFIDGDHSYQACKDDWELCKAIECKYILLHDADLEPIQRVAEEAKAEDGLYRFVERVDKIFVFERTAAA